MKWIIVDLSGLTDECWCARRWGHVLPVDDRPTFIHEDRERAETELCRLTAALRRGWLKGGQDAV